MSLENASFIHQLDAANPSGSDRLATGDDHIRMLKAAIKATFPNITGPMNLDQGFLNGLVNAALPVGIITLFAGASAPSGWAICDGGTYPRADGSGNIVAPDLRGRAAVGASADHPLGVPFGQASKTVTSEASGGHTHTASTSAAGAQSGRETSPVALTIDQMPAHAHSDGVVDDGAAGVFNHGTVPAVGANIATVQNSQGFLEGMTSTVGGGQAHSHTLPDVPAHSHAVTVDAVPGHAHAVAVDVTQPSLALNYIIKL